MSKLHPNLMKLAELADYSLQELRLNDMDFNTETTIRYDNVVGYSANIGDSVFLFPQEDYGPKWVIEDIDYKDNKLIVRYRAVDLIAAFTLWFPSTIIMDN